MRTFAHAFRVLGDLEQRVMDLLWATEPVTVREVCNVLPGKPPLAYTTVMTTLDRLHKKGLLARDRDGSAFRYRPALTRDEYDRRIVEEAVRTLMVRSAGPVMAAFVELAATIDETNLEHLERLIAEHRKGGE